jgi:hypothetical protein
MKTDFQIEEYEISVDIEKTKQFYSTLPKISENCSCKDCEYFERVIIQKNIQFFKTLQKMGVDLTRQPNTNPDGVCSVGPTEKYERAYMGYYKVFGQIGSKIKIEKNSEGKMVSTYFKESVTDSSIQYNIKQGIDDQLIFDFFLECEN